MTHVTCACKMRAVKLQHLLPQPAARNALALLFVQAHLIASAHKCAAVIRPRARPGVGGGLPLAPHIPASQVTQHVPHVTQHVPLQVVGFDRLAAFDALFLRVAEQPLLDADAAADSAATRHLHRIVQKAAAYIAHENRNTATKR